jgi:hypothetical protein
MMHPMNHPKGAPVALRLVIGKYVSQRETCYLNSLRIIIPNRAIFWRPCSP